MINFISEHWHLILALIIGIYEVLARLIPTVNDWSVLSWIIKLFKWISDSTNRSK